MAASSLAGVLRRQASALVTGKFFRPTSRLLFTSSTVNGAHDVEFEGAQKTLNTLKNNPGNQAKLKIYALFKQATIGKCNVPKPGMMDFVGKAKWDAWNGLGDISTDDAQKQYIEVVTELVAAEGGSTGSEETAATVTSSSGGSATSGLKVEVRDHMTIITLDRPAKKNALTRDMYRAIPKILKEVAEGSSSMAVITGSGDFYCSGNDLSNFMEIDPANMQKASEEGGEILKDFVAGFIDFPKPLVAVVNGPAVGVACTVLGLADAVYATDRATFHTPFSALGQTPEGCSSYVFPKIMGNAKASEVLIFNRKLSANEACDRGLVSEVIPDAVFQDEIWPRLKEMAANPPQTMQLSKQLIRSSEKELLHKVNNRECEQLVERWTSEECINAIMNFFSAKS